jgi:hypothetical protein
MTAQEKKQLMLERKLEQKTITIQRKNIRREIVRYGGRI